MPDQPQPQPSLFSVLLDKAKGLAGGYVKSQFWNPEMTFNLRDPEVRQQILKALQPGYVPPSMLGGGQMKGMIPSVADQGASVDKPQR